MENNISLHIKNFNDKVKLMNQTGGKNLMLSANEARSLHADIYDLMNLCAGLSRRLQSMQNSDPTITIAADGGTFK